jgi:hypothetical protein
VRRVLVTVTEGEGLHAAREARPLQTLLMMAASHAARTEYAPGERPYLVSRSGAAGMQRYVQTWSGDNHTSWETLRCNTRMGLGLAMSGVSNTGHDLGGFSGPAPGPELLLRWVQCGIFLPHFSIHSWNDDQTVNEPWMHPDVTPQVRELIKHEDDGLSQACRADAYGQWRLRVSCTLSGLHLAPSREGRRPPVQDRMVLRLPRSDVRTLGFTGAVLEEDAAEGDWRRLTLKLVD